MCLVDWIWVIPLWCGLQAAVIYQEQHDNPQNYSLVFVKNVANETTNFDQILSLGFQNDEFVCYEDEIEVLPDLCAANGMVLIKNELLQHPDWPPDPPKLVTPTNSPGNSTSTLPPPTTPLPPKCKYLQGGAR